MNIHLAPEEVRRVQVAAEKLGTSQAYVVRLILRDFWGLSKGEQGEVDMSTLRGGHVRDLTRMG